MKLFLASYWAGNRLDRLLAMSGGPGARMAIIANAVDAIPDADRWAYYRTVMDPIEHFGAAGFDPAVVDLRMYFGRPEPLRDVLRRHRVILVSGGNCFVLRRAMRLSGLDAMLPELLAEGLVYAGWSAGACVAGSDLRVIEPMDDPQTRGIGHPPGDPIFEGLGLVPYGIVPHYRSDHAEAEKAEESVALAERAGLPYRALRDGETIVVEAGREELLGGQ